jgi:predicted dehydrogenase
VAAAIDAPTSVVTRPLRVGVIGCGAIAQMMHLPTLAERPDLFTIAGLADIDAATLDAVAARYHVQRTTSDYRTLLAQDDIDAILVLASGTHRPFVTTALRAGKHVFVEKPLGFSLAETEELSAAAHTSRCVVQVGYHKRFDPAYRRARDLVRELADVRLVEVTVLHPDEDTYRRHHALLPRRDAVTLSEAQLDALTIRDALAEEIRPSLEATLGSDAPQHLRVATFVLLTSLIHDINLVRGLVGEPEEVLSAHVWRHGMAQSSLTRFAGDLRVSMTWISVPELAHYEERVRLVTNERRVTLVFPSPYLRHAPTALEVERMADGSCVVEQHTVSYEEAFRDELHQFRHAVVTGSPGEPGVDEAVADARWIESIARALVSAERRRSLV